MSLQRFETAHVWLALLLLCALLAIAGTLENHSHNPATGCRFDEVLTAHGECR